MLASHLSDGKVKRKQNRLNISHDRITMHSSDNARNPINKTVAGARTTRGRSEVRKHFRTTSPTTSQWGHKRIASNRGLTKKPDIIPRFLFLYMFLFRSPRSRMGGRKMRREPNIRGVVTKMLAYLVRRTRTAARARGRSALHSRGDRHGRDRPDKGRRRRRADGPAIAH